MSNQPIKTFKMVGVFLEKRNNFKLLAAAVLVLGSTSCSRAFTILLHPSTGEITFRKPYLLVLGTSFEPCLSELSIYSAPGRSVLLWRIVSKGQKCKRVRSVHMRASNAGFEERGLPPTTGSVQISAIDGKGYFGISRFYRL